MPRARLILLSTENDFCISSYFFGYTLLNKWLEKQGVDPKKYEEMQKSFSVDNKIKRARGMTQSYKIAATPTLVVNGRFLLEQAGSSERMFENAERLIAEARQAARPAAAAKK